MRLNQFEIESIKNLVNSHFGKDAQVFLFGSRVQDEKRGGDIDLFISNSNGEQLKVRTKINFMTDLVLRIGDQKIDVILDSPAIKKSVFYQSIKQTGILL
jgi:predicted nucleotidyltransferase